MADELTVVSTKVDGEMLDELDGTCDAQKRNRSQAMWLALREWLDRQDSKPKPRKPRAA